MRAIPLALLLLLVGWTEAPAQVNRLHWIIQGGYIEGAAVTTGLRWTYTPAPVERRDPATGMPLPIRSRPSLHAALTGGVTFAEPGDRSADWTAVATAGPLLPIAVGPISRAGPVALGSLNPHGIGPAVRVESAFQAFALDAGVLFFDGRPTRAAALVELSGIFIRDLFR